MTSKTKESVECILKNAPNFLTALNLVEIGLFQSTSEVYKARDRDQTPPCIQITEKKLRFPKDSLMEWLETRKIQLKQ